jgi:membrane associated rhomboid family serine protease
VIPLHDDVPSATTPFITVSLIVLNILVYLYQTFTGMGQEMWAWQFGLIPNELTSGVEQTPELSAPVTLNLFTSMFLHGGFLHLAGNMLYLWIFGDNVEDRLGHTRFLVFYLVCGVAAALFFIWTAPHLRVPLVGASGAIAGVLGAYLLSYPKARIATLIFFGFFIRIVYIPALIVLGLWFLLQIFSGLPALGAEKQAGGTAFFAHVGGFIAGMLLIWPMSLWRGNSSGS